MRTYIGIDNGVSGSIALVEEGRALFVPVPNRSEQSYTKAKAKITRVDWMELEILLASWLVNTDLRRVRVFVERPYVNPKGFKATVSALRALEATLITLERLQLSYEYVDSRQWQKAMLPSGCKGAELKHASKDVGKRLFPSLAGKIEKQKDADGLLIAEWARRESR